MLPGDTIDGVITTVHKRQGENIVEGEPVFTITRAQGQRIIAYARHPLRVEPKVGMSVKVRTRNGTVHVGEGKILEIAPTIEPIPLLSHARSPIPGVDRGLPFFVSLPPGLQVRPGELVDLALLAEAP